jgi:ppGpp synthetase/RelA/SpoT-type nucleotidyltranferase
VAAELDQASLVAAYEKHVGDYEKLLLYLEAGLKEALLSRGISGEVKGRVKEPLSFVTKALIGNRYDNPIAEIVDKIGVRIILTYDCDLDAAEKAVASVTKIEKRESKLDALAYNENGYQGVHLDVAVEEAQATKIGVKERKAEVQIRTRAQAAWSEVSHEQLYKPAADVPDKLKRRIYRLVALVEVFDSEIAQFLNEASAAPGFQEASQLGSLHVQLVRLGVRQVADRELTRLLAAAIIPLYEGMTDLTSHLVKWIEAHEPALKVLIEEAEKVGPGGMNPLVAQPEIVPILERLEYDSKTLQANWPEEIPYGWLTDLAERWGKPLDFG